MCTRKHINKDNLLYRMHSMDSNVRLASLKTLKALLQIPKVEEIEISKISRILISTNK